MNRRGYRQTWPPGSGTRRPSETEDDSRIIAFGATSGAGRVAMLGFPEAAGKTGFWKRVSRVGMLGLLERPGAEFAMERQHRFLSEAARRGVRRHAVQAELDLLDATGG